MKAKITAIAPTSYQLRSLSHFGEYRPVGDGSFIFEKEFETEEEAKQYLLERAKEYCETYDEFMYAKTSIMLCGILRIDAVSGIIELI